MKKIDFSINTNVIHGWLLLCMAYIMLNISSGWDKYIGIIPGIIALSLFIKKDEGV